MPASWIAGISRSPKASNCSREAQISLTCRLPSGPKQTWYSIPSGGKPSPSDTRLLTASYCSVVMDAGAKRTRMLITASRRIMCCDASRSSAAERNFLDQERACTECPRVGPEWRFRWSPKTGVRGCRSFAAAIGPDVGRQAALSVERDDDLAIGAALLDVRQRLEGLVERERLVDERAEVARVVEGRPACAAGRRWPARTETSSSRLASGPAFGPCGSAAPSRPPWTSAPRAASRTRGPAGRSRRSPVRRA